MSSSEVSTTNNPIMERGLLPEGIAVEDFKSIDEHGCLPAVMALMLSKIGIPTSAEEAERISGRKPGELPSYQGTTNLILHALKSGVTVRDVQLPYSVEMIKYFTPDTSLTYEDFIEEMHYVYNGYFDEHLRTSYPKEIFEQDMAARRAGYAQLQDYVALNQYGYEQRAIDVNFLSWSCDKGALAAFLQSTASASHAILLLSCKPVQDKWNVTYFDPSPNEGIISIEIDPDTESLETIFSPTYGVITFSR